MIIDEKKLSGYTFIEDAKRKEFTKKLLELAREHPDYPIVVLAGECASDGDHCYTYCSEVSVGLDRILNCETPWWNEETVCTDPEAFEEEVNDRIWDKLEEQLGREPTEEECDEAVKEVLKAHEPYWIDVISITGDN